MPYILFFGISMHIFCREFLSTWVFISPSINQLIAHETSWLISSGAKFSPKKNKSGVSYTIKNIYWSFGSQCNLDLPQYTWDVPRDIISFWHLLHPSPLLQCLWAIDFTAHRWKANLLFLFFLQNSSKHQSFLVLIELWIMKMWITYIQ